MTDTDSGRSPTEPGFRASHGAADASPPKASIPSAYPDENYVIGLRDLAGALEMRRTGNWAAIAGVLKDCACLIEHYAQETETRRAETLGSVHDGSVGEADAPGNSHE